MRKDYVYGHQCPTCMFRYDCNLSPFKRNYNNNSDPASAHIVFFPELLTEVSLPELFPELFFYP